MSSFLKSLQKKIGNKNASIVSDGIVGDLSGFIDTGSFLLNAAVSGSMFKGFPDNKVAMLAGPAGVGKSFILLTMISRFLQKYPKGTVIFFESESAQRQDTMESFGIDTSRVLFVPITTVQELRGQCLQILEEYEKVPPKERIENKMFMCLDSLGNLSTSKEMSDSVEGKETQDMTRAKLIKSTFRVLTLKLGVLGVPFIVTNHIYMSQSLYPQAITGGGSGGQYLSSTICMLSKRKEKEGTDFVGNVVHCKMDKSRFTKEGSTIDILINFSTGLSLYHGILDEMVSAGLVKSTGTRFEFPGSDAKIFRKEVNRNPEKYFSQELMEKLDVVLAKKFLYGSVLSSQGIELEEGDVSDDEDVVVVEEEDLI